MKSILLALTMLASVSGFAAEITLAVNPDTPIVILGDVKIGDGKGDEQWVRGPWFKGEFSVSNTGTEMITITGLDFVVTSIEGTELRRIANLENAVEIDGAAQYSFSSYVGSLPESSSFAYQVKVKLLGHRGSIGNPTGRFEATLDFVTQ